MDSITCYIVTSILASKYEFIHGIGLSLTLVRVILNHTKIPIGTVEPLLLDAECNGHFFNPD